MIVIIMLLATKSLNSKRIYYNMNIFVDNCSFCHKLNFHSQLCLTSEKDQEKSILIGGQRALYYQFQKIVKPSLDIIFLEIYL